MKNIDENDIQYQIAKKQVEQLRGFYIHVFIYLGVNLIIVYYNYTNLEPGESYFQFKNFFTATFWGMGILAHAASVFLPRTRPIKKWEEKKIKDLMDQQKKY
ncbi:2TM domain-containing protein [Chryseobacterium sp. JK1]|uniref:2TM domain-containing protein n=1 Tax=Chryseobacterium sp. JK1 TaxID=874294 RepID=UPI003D685843